MVAVRSRRIAKCAAIALTLGLVVAFAWMRISGLSESELDVITGCICVMAIINGTRVSVAR